MFSSARMPFGVASRAPPKCLMACTKRSCRSGVQRRRGLTSGSTCSAVSGMPRVDRRWPTLEAAWDREWDPEESDRRAAAAPPSPTCSPPCSQVETDGFLIDACHWETKRRASPARREAQAC